MSLMSWLGLTCRHEWVEVTAYHFGDAKKNKSDGIYAFCKYCHRIVGLVLNDNVPIFFYPDKEKENE